MTEPGLCGECAHRQLVRSARGSEFLMCGLAKQDDRFPKYPRLPKLTCEGFLRADAERKDQ